MFRVMIKKSSCFVGSIVLIRLCASAWFAYSQPAIAADLRQFPATDLASD
jgi:hypothetical protein